MQNGRASIKHGGIWGAPPHRLLALPYRHVRFAPISAVVPLTTADRGGPLARDGSGGTLRTWPAHATLAKQNDGHVVGHYILYPECRNRRVLETCVPETLAVWTRSKEVRNALLRRARRCWRGVESVETTGTRDAPPSQPQPISTGMHVLFP
ncbi:hypothetical protein FZEAL_10587 [Fusarium zealandicum]|uniref:Uncharacterized protein n=1 Tax=Fusarium zealandicum TaxID=1053134 RepID=A0A8H4X9K2_9HYPO|nr:hypothetical protein FZEAL_10587 [Fusarium zealandicum]